MEVPSVPQSLAPECVNMIHSVLKSFFMAQVACERLVNKRGELIVRSEADFINDKDYSSPRPREANLFSAGESECVFKKGADHFKSELRKFLRPRLREILEGTIGDSREINEIRAEIATLRSEIIELRSV
jgi:hypothetical protein